MQPVRPVVQGGPPRQPGPAGARQGAPGSAFSDGQGLMRQTGPTCCARSSGMACQLGPPCCIKLHRHAASCKPDLR